MSVAITLVVQAIEQQDAWQENGFFLQQQQHSLIEKDHLGDCSPEKDCC